MNVYTIGLFAHFIGLIVLFSAFALHARGAWILRRATGMEQALVGMSIGRSTGPMFPVGALLLILSGLHMTGVQWSFSAPWISVGLVSVVVMAATGGTVGRAHGNRLAARVTETRGPIPAALAEEIGKPGPEVTGFALNGGAFGILWIMATKPGWTGSIVSIAVGVLIGAAVGVMFVRAAGRAKAA